VTTDNAKPAGNVNVRQVVDAAIAYFINTDYRYTAPSVLTEADLPVPMRYPVVTTYDMDSDIQVFVVCVVNQEEIAKATEWVNELAAQIMVQWAPPDEEPLEFDSVTWVGLEPPIALRSVISRNPGAASSTDADEVARLRADVARLRWVLTHAANDIDYATENNAGQTWSDYEGAVKQVARNIRAALETGEAQS
jgi:hypothetical protein